MPNEQIVVDAVANETMRAIYRLSGPNIWRMEYKIEYQFKDGKILFRPIFKRLENADDDATVSLHNGIYDKKGEAKKEKANIKMNNEINRIFDAFNQAITKSSKNSDW